jgi:excisionase family DNA binding protein
MVRWVFLQGKHQDVRRCPPDILQDVPGCPCDVRPVWCIVLGMPAPALLMRSNVAALALARVGLTRDAVMTASEVADLLHLPVSTVYYLARQGELPARRLGRSGGSCAHGSRKCCVAERAGVSQGRGRWGRRPPES